MAFYRNILPRVCKMKFCFPSYITIVALVALCVSIIRLVIIHHYVDWKFLWGGDQIPILNFKDFIESVFKLELPWRDFGILFVPQLSLIIMRHIFSGFISCITRSESLENNASGWIANSIMFFFGALVLWYVISPFKYLNNRHRYAAFIIALVFFTFNPWATIDTFKSYLSLTSLQAFLAFALISFYIRLLRFLLESSALRGYEILFIIAITLALHSISPSEAIRGFAFLFTLEVFFVPFATLSYYRLKKVGNIGCYEELKSKMKNALLISLIPLIVVATMLIFYIMAGYIAPLRERVISLWGGLTPPKQRLYPTYATMSNSFIGMTSWIAHSIHMPYHSLYEKGLIAGSMFLWPLIGMGGALLLSMRSKVDHVTRMQILMLLSLSLVFLAWGTALNPPLAWAKKYVVDLMPLIVKVLPWGFSSHYLRFVYIVLTSYVLGYILTLVSSRRHAQRRMAVSHRLLAVPAIACIALLLLTAAPIFNGEVFGQYYDQSIKGFNIPRDYEELMGLNVPFHEHILLLPKTHIYTSTKWGWQGSIGWYHRLNSAILTYTLVPYSAYTKWGLMYSKLSRPCAKVEKGLPLTELMALGKIRVYNGKIIAAELSPNGMLKMSLMLFRGKYTDIVLPLVTSINVSTYKALEINLNLTGRQDIVLSPWLFIRGGKFNGTHILPTATLPVHISKVYAVGEPDRPWLASKYDPSRITGFILRLKILNYGSADYSIVNASLRISVGNYVSLCQSYLSLLDLLNVRYIVVDHSLNTYNKFYEIIEGALQRCFKQVYKGSTLTVYEVDKSRSPLTVVKPCNDAVIVEPIHVDPTYIKIRIDLKESTREILLVIPMLYQKELPTPLRLSAYVNGTFLKVKPVNYYGLQGYVIKTSGYKNIIVTATYTPSFTALYICLIILNLIPLFLLALSTYMYLHHLNVKGNRCQKQGS